MSTKNLRVVYWIIHREIRALAVRAFHRLNFDKSDNLNAEKVLSVNVVTTTQAAERDWAIADPTGVHSELKKSHPVILLPFFCEARFERCVRNSSLKTSKGLTQMMMS